MSYSAENVVFKNHHSVASLLSATFNDYGTMIKQQHKKHTPVYNVSKSILNKRLNIRTTIITIICW